MSMHEKPTLNIYLYAYILVLMLQWQVFALASRRWWWLRINGMTTRMQLIRWSTVLGALWLNTGTGINLLNGGRIVG